jgi:hypothetical protein
VPSRDKILRQLERMIFREEKRVPIRHPNPLRSQRWTIKKIKKKEGEDD